MNKIFFRALAISLLIHLLLVVSASLIPALDFNFEASPIEVFLEEPQGGWRVADIPEPAVQEKPKKSQFLGMYSQKVKDESVTDTKLAAGKEPLDKARGRQGAGSNPPSPPLKKGGKGEFAMKSPIEKGTEVSTGTPLDSGAAMPEDFYPDFKHGEHTYINVLRYPDIEYFVRLKRIFKMTWDPVPAIRRDMAETSVSRGGVSVVLAVSVDKSGDLSELFVLRSSGLTNYDDEAVRTVRASSPFSAPPEKFLKDDDVVRMSWTFVIYL